MVSVGKSLQTRCGVETAITSCQACVQSAYEMMSITAAFIGCVQEFTSDHFDLIPHCSFIFSA